MRILIIDDEPLVHDLLKVAIAEQGFADPISCFSIDDAIHHIKYSAGDDLIFCDIELPEKDGFDFLMFAEGWEVDAPIILMSGHEEKLLHSVKNIYEDSRIFIVDTLPKPFQIPSVMNLLEKYSGAQHGVAVDRCQPLAEKEILPYLCVYYQPKVKADSGLVVGVEALVRVNHPQRGIVSPADFLPVLENKPAFYPMTLEVIKQSFIASQHLSKSYPALQMSINITINDLKEPSFASTVLNFQKECLVDQRNIIFEITENQIFDNDKRVINSMGRLVMAGFHFSLDDFGTGFSNLERLRAMPLSELKLDMLFSQNVLNDAFSNQICRSVVDISRSLNLSSVVEGVETQEQSDFFAEIGVDVLQGYLFSKPLPLDLLEVYLEGNAQLHPLLLTDAIT